MAKLNRNTGPVILDSTGRTMRNGGVIANTSTRPGTFSLDRTLTEGGTGPTGQITLPNGVPGTTPIQTLTGGNTPPGTIPLATTGGPAQATAIPTVQTGGNTPALPVATTTGQLPPTGLPPVTTGGTLPPTPTNPVTGLPSLDGNQYVANPQPGSGGTTTQVYNPGTGFHASVPTVGSGYRVPAAAGSGKTVQDYLNGLLDENGSYIQNAARRGLETAGSRGLLNSSIAAGASTRSAIEAAMPILNEIMGLHNNREGMAFQQDENKLNRQLQERLQALGFNFEDAQNAANRALQMNMQREGLAFQGEQNSLDRIQSVNNRLLEGSLAERMAQLQSQYQANAARQDFEFRRTLQNDSVLQQDWLRSNEFADQFNASISMIPVNSSMDMLQQLTQFALSDPETFTPDVMSGFTTFFNNNMVNLLSQYFPGSTSGGNS